MFTEAGRHLREPFVLSDRNEEMALSVVGKPACQNLEA